MEAASIAEATVWRPGTTARTRDEARQHAAPPPLADYMRHAVRMSGRSVLSIVRESLALQRGPGRLPFREYVQLGLYRPSLDDAERRRFLSESLHWPIVDCVNDFTWQAATEDKWLCASLLERFDIPTVPVLAVIDLGGRPWPGMRVLEDARSVSDFMREHLARGALFGKVNRGLASHGVFLATSADARSLHLEGEGEVAWDAFFARFVKTEPCLLQPLISNHSFFDRFTTRAATVRVYCLRTSDGLRIPFTVLKLAAADQIADNFWRSGNLACEIDGGTGRILRACIQHPLGAVEHQEHPGTGAVLVGETLPFWSQVLDLAREVSAIFGPVRYHSLDIAIGESGPVVVEVNTGGSFTLAQTACARGFLTDEVREHFRACGYRKV